MNALLCVNVARLMYVMYVRTCCYVGHVGYICFVAPVMYLFTVSMICSYEDLYMYVE